MTIFARLFRGAKSVADNPPATSADSRKVPVPTRPEKFKAAQELALYVTSELERCVPNGWHVEQLNRSGNRLVWAIKKDRPEPGEWFDQEYDLWITTDLEWMIITHDNRDIGLGPFFEHAIVMRVESLRSGDWLAYAVREVMSKFRPNEWGYT